MWVRVPPALLCKLGFCRPRVVLKGSRFGSNGTFEARNRLFTTAVGLIGAVGLLGILLFTWRNFLLAESGQIADRFAKAVELLGAVRDVGEGRVEPNIEARLGAIYALEPIAQDSARGYWQVMEVLAAHVRNAPAPPSSATDSRDLRPDDQAALDEFSGAHFVWLIRAPAAMQIEVGEALAAAW